MTAQVLIDASRLPAQALVVQRSSLVRRQGLLRLEADQLRAAVAVYEALGLVTPLRDRITADGDHGASAR
jgi:hypothetical protein